jgi:hypothetical protein
MFKSEDFLTRSANIPKSFGIYIAQPRGSRMRVIDKKRADIMPSVNDTHIKFGKAHNLQQRFKNYYFDNDGDVDFTPVIICDNYSKEDLVSLEKLIKSRVDSYRMRNPKTNRRLEWLVGISFENLKKTILKAHKEFESLCE